MKGLRRPPAALRDNAFAVLGVEPSATRRQVESAAQKRLAQLELGVSAARSFACPATGEIRELDAELLREALRSLRDPKSRAREELYWLVAQAWS